ncbi:hypothetical protein [Faecalibacter rhinopitheci]|uniref:Uncharacterized protein n=1 Tax=Faecalibacter rhinopitheci TaxID=2779678 RepID=A0A8J7FP34_9FLAO|nr:hypothetical protein [Faecalibacter rhinopitheci]MBF0597270.1 hypothetical protein [Faecalibacter rhinopitheci]
MSFEISINEFNRQFQLYQKNGRYNLNVYNLDINHFIVTFFQNEIEDLEISFSCKEKGTIYQHKISHTTFNHYFESVENLLDHNIHSLNGYFHQLDLYFHSSNEFLEINYIQREILFDIIDQLLNGMDCNYKSRLKTELLINMEFD